MMKQEFEKLAGIKVTEETYYNIIEPMYLATDLNKQDFIKTLNLKNLKAEEKKEKIIKAMGTRDHSGCRMTPNGCYYHIEYVELVDVDIKRRKFKVKPLEESDYSRDELIGMDRYLGYHVDFDYTECVDMKNKPIEMKYIYY